MHADVSVGIGIDAPPDEVFAFVTDWSRQSVWIPSTRVRQLGGGTGLGAEVVARTAVGPIGFDDPMVVTAWDPPRRCETLHTGRVVRGTGAFVVEARGTGSHFVWSETVAVPGGPVAQAVWFIGGPATELLFAWALRRLKKAVES